MPGRNPVVWSPPAERDLENAWRYFSRVASPEIADRLVREIASTSARLELDQFIGRSRDEFGAGIRSIPVHPYTIFYRIRDGKAEVIRVLHERQDFGVLGSEETAG